MVDIVDGVHVVPPHVRAAVLRLIDRFPATWKQRLEEPRLEGVPVDAEARVYDIKNNSTVIISSSNRIIYEHIVGQTHVPKDLLANFKALCVRDSVDLTGIPDKDIWNGIYNEDNYAKFTDLHWRLIMAINRTGEAWMDKSDCPICGETQLSEYLFWKCPAAQVHGLHYC